MYNIPSEKMFSRFFQKLFFRVRERINNYTINNLRKIHFRFQGMKIGEDVQLSKINITWPHQVYIGNKCILENNIFFKFDGIWEKGPRIRIGNNCFIGMQSEFNIRQEIIIGDDCLIASGCKFIDHDHGFSRRDISINIQNDGIEIPIVLANDVWLGVNVVILKGVEIGKGAIVAAGSIVNKSIPPYEIWAGIPARKISDRPHD